MKLFLNRRAGNTFCWTLLLFTVLLAGSIFWLYNTEKNREQTANLDLIGYRTFEFMNAAKNKRIGYITHALKHHFPSNLRLNIKEKPYKSNIISTNVRQQKIYQLVFHYRYKLKLSFYIEKNKWLNMYLTPPSHTILTQRFSTLFITLWLAACLLLYSITRLLSAPISEFSNAIRQLGIDLNAPSLNEVGDSEMRACIRDFNDMQLRIRGLFRERTQLLAAISHDLKTPITRLKLRAEQFEGSPEHEKFVNDLDEMEHMISSILTYAGHTAREETRQSFDLGALLQTLCDDMQDAGKEVTFNGANKRLVLKGQLNGIRRVFANLIDNAIKYGHVASIHITPLDKRVKITITDQGSGIPEGNFDLAFKPFERLDHSRSANIAGSGLGLAIVKETIVAHHGEISLGNVAKGGLRVTVLLPLGSSGN